MIEIARRCRDEDQLWNIVADLRNKGITIIGVDPISLIITCDDTPFARKILNGLPRISCI